MGAIGISLVGDPLWQWDTGRSVLVAGSAPGDLLDVAASDARMALSVEVAADGTAPVPDQLLARPTDRLLCFLRRGNATVAARSLPVRGRPRPADYAQSVTPTVGYQALRAEMLGMLGELSEQVKAAGLVKAVEAPLSVDASGTLRVDVGAASRGTQIGVGADPPTEGVRAGDSFVRTTDMALLIAEEG